MRKMKRRQKKRLAFLVMVVLVASLIAIIMLTPAFNIRKIEIVGNSVLKDEQIVKASGLTTGVNIFGESMKEAKDNVMSLGYIDSVKVKRSLPSTVRISVVEEVGVAYLRAEDGFVIITADGRCIDINDGTDGGKKVKIPDYPLIKGMKNVKYKVGKIISAENETQLEALIACLHEFSKYGYVFDIREIDMSDITDIKFYFRTMDLCVAIGNTDKLGYKMECFGSILESLQNPQSGYINLKHENPTYRRSINPEPIEPKEEKEE